MLIVGFAIFGELVLRYLHVSISRLSIAGGQLLLLVALEMLRGEVPEGIVVAADPRGAVAEALRLAAR